MPSATTHEPTGPRQTRMAAASGWIGSALEYYDFFIYATAASLVFPQLFFPSTDPTVAIVASLATYGGGYVARPIGVPICGKEPKKLRLSGGACSTAMSAAPPHSPPAEKPCTTRRKISRIGAQTPACA